MVDLEHWRQEARRDNVFERMVPSDLREIVGAALRYRSALEFISEMVPPEEAPEEAEAMSLGAGEYLGMAYENAIQAAKAALR